MSGCFSRDIPGAYTVRNSQRISTSQEKEENTSGGCIAVNDTCVILKIWKLISLLHQSKAGQERRILNDTLGEMEVELEMKQPIYG